MPFLNEEVQVPTLDAATTTAIARWRADALTRVSPSLQDAVAAMYADQRVDPSMVNPASMARAQAERAAWLSPVQKGYCRPGSMMTLSTLTMVSAPVTELRA
jgi:hypothetical protein